MENRNWVNIKLGDALTFQRGHDLPKSKMIDGIYQVAGSNGVIGCHNVYTTSGPGITIGRSGNIGTPHYYKDNFWAHNTVLYVKDFKGNNELFLYYFLKNIDFSSFNTGSAVPSLNRNHVHEYEIQFPPLPEQKAIASVLSSLDDKIDLLHQQNQTLEALAETLFRQWFIEDDGEKSIRYSLHDLVDSVSIKHNFLKNELIFLNTSDILKGNILHNTYSSIKDLPGQAKKSIQRKDILFSEIRPANGRWAFVDFDGNDFVVSTKLMVLRSKGILSPEFIYLYLTQNDIVNELQLLAEDRSGTFPQITFDILKKFEINFASEDLMQQANDYSISFLSKISENQKQIQTLTKLRDTLLPKLMSGEVRVQL